MDILKGGVRVQLVRIYIKALFLTYPASPFPQRHLYANHVPEKEQFNMRKGESSLKC